MCFGVVIVFQGDISSTLVPSKHAENVTRAVVPFSLFVCLLLNTQKGGIFVCERACLLLTFMSISSGDK
jgi:hypothetical protein